MMLCTALLVASAAVSVPTLDAPIGLEQAWKRYDMPKVRMSAELPTPPKDFEYDINKTTDLAQKATWMVVPLNESYIIYSYTLYKPGQTVDLKEAINGAIRTLQQNLNIKVSPESKPIKVSGLPGFKVRVVYDFRGDKTVYSSIFVAKDRRMWQVIANYPSDPETSKVVDRAFNSTTIQH